MMRDFVMKPGHFYIMRHRNLFKTFFTASFLWYHSHRGKGGGVLPYYYQVEIEVQVPQWPQLTPKRKRVLLLLIARQEWEFWLIKWCPLTSWVVLSPLDDVPSPFSPASSSDNSSAERRCEMMEFRFPMWSLLMVVRERWGGEGSIRIPAFCLAFSTSHNRSGVIAPHSFTRVVIEAPHLASA